MWRDIDELQRCDFPVFGRGSAAFSPAKREPGELNVPVACGDVVVEPGDVVVADASGVAVVPRWCAGEVVAALMGRRSRLVAPLSATEPDAGSVSRTPLFEQTYRERGGANLQ